MPHSHHKNHFINFPIHKSTNHQLEHQLIHNLHQCMPGRRTNADMLENYGVDWPIFAAQLSWCFSPVISYRFYYLTLLHTGPITSPTCYLGSRWLCTSANLSLCILTVSEKENTAGLFDCVPQCSRFIFKRVDSHPDLIYISVRINHQVATFARNMLRLLGLLLIFRESAIIIIIIKKNETEDLS